MSIIDTSHDDDLFSQTDLLAPDIDQDVEEDSESPWTRWQGTDFPNLPKMTAVRRAYEAARDQGKGGLPDEFAWALANAAVDPSELRAIVGSPRQMPVAGGVFEFIETDLFVPAVAPLMTNHRAVSRRIYPASGATGTRIPLRGPISLAGSTTTLQVEASSVAHVIDQAAATRSYVLTENKLRESIEERGIMMPVEVVNIEAIHEDGSPAASLLCTAEGSSRITNAQEILGLTEPRQVLYDLPGDNDAYRRLVSEVLREDPAEEGLSNREAKRRRARRNALVVRARVILRFRPTGHRNMTFAESLASYVGLIHVEGPKQWERVGKNEAVVEGVLRALEYHSDLEPVEIEYLSGMLDPGQAELEGYFSERDAHAAFVLRRLLHPDLKQIVNRAIREAGVVARVRDARRAEVAAELALRPTRGFVNSATSVEAAQIKRLIDAMGPSYRRAAQAPLFRTGDWSVTGRSPQQLLEESNREFADGGPGPAATELAALAMYHLTYSGALGREAYGARSGQGDTRGPQTILEGLLATDFGRQQMCQAIVDGRAGQRIRAVAIAGGVACGRWDEEESTFEPDPAGPEVLLTAGWLRGEIVPDTSVPRPMPSVDPSSETPTMKLDRLTKSIEDLASQLDAAVQQVRDLTFDDGSRLIEQSGWQCANVIRRLNGVRDDLVFWDRFGQAMVSRPVGGGE